MVSRFLALGALFFALLAVPAQACVAVTGTDSGGGWSRLSIARCQTSNAPVQYQVIEPNGAVVARATVDLKVQRMAFQLVPSAMQGTYTVQVVSAGSLNVFESQWEVKENVATENSGIVDTAATLNMPALLGFKIVRKGKRIDVVVRNSSLDSSLPAKLCVSSAQDRLCKTIAALPSLSDARVKFRFVGKLKATLSSGTDNVSCLVRSSSGAKACGWFGR